MQQLHFQVAALSVIIIINSIKIAPHPSFPTSHWEGSKGERGLGSYTGHSLSALLHLCHPPAPMELFVGTWAVVSRSPWLGGGWGRNAVYAESSHCCKLHLKAKLPQCLFFPHKLVNTGEKRQASALPSTPGMVRGSFILSAWGRSHALEMDVASQCVTSLLRLHWTCWNIS